MDLTEDDTKEKLALIEKKIVDAFKVFDHDNNNTCDVREVGAIIRSLGLVPTEAELNEIISELEDNSNDLNDTDDMLMKKTDENNGNSGDENGNGPVIRLEKFTSIMLLIMTSNKMKPVSEEILLQAFQVLDTAKNNYLTEEQLTNAMTKEGEPFSQEEMAEMLEVCLDMDDDLCHYKHYLQQLIIQKE